MMKYSILSIYIFSICFAQSSIQGLGGFYHANTLASAGAPGAVNNVDSDQINPAGIALLVPQVQFGLIKYPANISAQSAVYINTIKKGNYAIALRRINYGTFDKIDENGVGDQAYIASDTWLNATYAMRNNNFNIGISTGLFVSNLGSYNTTVLIISGGLLYDYHSIDAQFGLSLTNFGIFISRYTDYKEQLPKQVTISGNKGLKYLPLDVNIDISYDLSHDKIFARVGGVFQLPYSFHLKFGANSNNIEQSTEYRNLKSFLSSSGIGLEYHYRQYSIEIGGYSYGTGGWIYGTSFNYQLQ